MNLNQYVTLKQVNMSTTVIAHGTAHHRAKGLTFSPFLKLWLVAQ
ncbi:hypothetical protein EVA_21124 [gut metagenome]|uniref:Uncharacterized protein n=1 Tax=gut metagenome TaxID=749906 RepID=J9FTR9_9ZZZZ